MDMKNEEKTTSSMIEALKERAKELNCLYHVEEVLNNFLLSLPEVFEGIIRAIPPGWQFPEFCQARIIYENYSYQSPDYCITPWVDSCSIKVENRVVGLIEVSYVKEVPHHDDVVTLSEKTFRIASKYMSDSEITIRLKKLISEEKVNLLINAIERIDSSVSEIIDLIIRNRSIAENIDMLYSPKERCLKVSLIRRFLSDKLEFINVAKQYIEVRDFYEIFSRIIFSAGSNGKIGGKSSGLFLAQKILEKEKNNLPVLNPVKVPKTWYITTDEVVHFLHYNNLEELSEQKYRGIDEIRMDYPHIIQMMKNCRFPTEIVKSLAMVLDDFTDSPLIVRSSSLLEDQVGAAFSGKYKSIFLANQGSKQERLKALMDAIIEVYASIFNPDSIQYRSEKGLLDLNEEMGIMIQEVVGVRVGKYYLPVFAGVAFSHNEFRWSPQIKQEDGLVRIVSGLGTRAVDRLGDDFPVLVSPGSPGLRVNTVVDEVIRYSPKKIDVINLNENILETIDIISLVNEYGDQIPGINHIVSICRKIFWRKYFPNIVILKMY